MRSVVADKKFEARVQVQVQVGKAWREDRALVCSKSCRYQVTSKAVWGCVGEICTYIYVVARNAERSVVCVCDFDLRWSKGLVRSSL